MQSPLRRHRSSTPEPRPALPPAARRRLVKLEGEVAELRAELTEQRLLGLRVAELSDLVTELIGAAARGPEEFDAALARYRAELQ